MGEGQRCNVNVNVTTCYAGHTHGGFHMDSPVTATTSFQR